MCFSIRDVMMPASYFQVIQQESTKGYKERKKKQMEQNIIDDSKLFFQLFCCFSFSRQTVLA